MAEATLPHQGNRIRDRELAFLSRMLYHAQRIEPGESYPEGLVEASLPLDPDVNEALARAGAHLLRCYALEGKRSPPES